MESDTTRPTHQPPSPGPGPDQQDPAPVESRCQSLVFCPRCGFPATTQSDTCQRCGMRRCVSCSE
ncbi:MAG: hypothetical protein AB7G11_04735 [Phycisphaerales bacterium]